MKPYFDLIKVLKLSYSFGEIAKYLMRASDFK